MTQHNDHQTNPPVADGEGVELPPAIPQPHGGVLRPFVKGDPRAAAGRLRAVEVRRERAAMESARFESVQALLSGLVEAAPRDQLGPAAAACAQHIVGQIAAGDIRIRHADDAASLLKVLVDVARLEEGQHTGATIVAHADTGAMIARIAELREQAQAVGAGIARQYPDAVDAVVAELSEQEASDVR